MLCVGIYRCCIVNNALPSKLFFEKQYTTAGIHIKKPPTFRGEQSRCSAYLLMLYCFPAPASSWTC